METVKRNPQGRQRRAATQYPTPISAYARRHAQLAQMSDEDLMTQLQTGAADAFDLLVDRYTRPLGNFLYRYLGDREVCEDLLQETFIRVYRNRHAYRRIARFSTWLYTIAGNLARSEYRRRKRHRVSSLQLVNRDAEEFEAVVPDLSHLPDEETEGTLQDNYLQRALRHLSEEFREVVVLRDVQELAYDEIAEITGLPMGTIKSRIHRGRTRLQEMLRDVYAA